MNLKWAARLLIMGGAVALGLCGGAVLDAYLVQRIARERFAAMPSVHEPSAELSKAGALVVLAELSIPRLGFSSIVLEGSDERTLRVGPGHVETTSMPGTSGNVVIAGHRDTFFRPLRHIKLGDDIWLDAAGVRVHYQVSSLDVVGTSEVSVLAPTSTATLTLVTCYPFSFIGPAPDRFIVRAEAVGK